MLLSNPATFDKRPLTEGHALAEAGYSVTILAWDREGVARRDVRYQDGLTILRMRLLAGHGTPVRTVPKLLIFWAWCVLRLLPLRADAVHCHDVDALPAGFAAKNLGLAKELVYDMHDLPEAFLRFFPQSQRLQSLFLALCKKQADLVITASEGFSDFLRSFGFRKERLVTVLNAPSLAEGRQGGRADGPFNVFYYGGLEAERGIRQLVEAVEGIPYVTLSLAGRGTLSDWVTARAASNPRIRFLGWLDGPGLRKETSGASILPSLYNPTTKNIMLSTPGKLLASLSLSLPALVPSGTHQAELVHDFRCGLAVNVDDPREVKEAISALANDRSLYEGMAESAHNAFTRELNWETMKKRLLAAYGSVMRRRPRG